MTDSIADLNTRCTAALRALEGAGVVRLCAINGQTVIATVGGEDVTHTVSAGTKGMDAVSHALMYDSRLVDAVHLDWEQATNVRHDLSDPVTAASLIVQVREAWGDLKIHTRFSESKKMWEVLRGRDKATKPMRWPGDKRGRLISDAVTEAEAFVAALEAKVQEVPHG